MLRNLEPGRTIVAKPARKFLLPKKNLSQTCWPAWQKVLRPNKKERPSDVPQQVEVVAFICSTASGESRTPPFRTSDQLQRCKAAKIGLQE